jgi:ABC-type uncharacterized transport system substrate-binding protein
VTGTGLAHRHSLLRYDGRGLGLSQREVKEISFNRLVEDFETVVNHAGLVIGAFREIVEAGAVMSYGIDLVGLFRDVAGVVDQIAKGANPAELPILQSSRFYLAINLKSATDWVSPCQ